MATPLDKMKEDASAYFKNTPVGQGTNFGGGTLTRTESGASFYDPSSNKTYDFGPDTSFETIAGASPGISDAWKAQYGYEPTAQAQQPQTPAATGNQDLFPATDLPAPVQMQVASDQYFVNTPIGTTSQFAGGSLTRTSAGAIFYDPATGKSYNLTQDMSLDDIAATVPKISDAWKTQYGYKGPAGGNTGTGKDKNLFPSSAGAPLAAGANTAGYTAPAGASTQDRLLSLLEKDNPFLVRERNKVERAAVGRGLQNTTMAATGGEAAAIDAAFNIASKDADLFANLYSQERGGEIESALSSQQAQQQGWLYKLQGDISANLSKLDADQQFRLQTALKGMDASQQMKMAQFEAGTASKLSAQEAAQARYAKIMEIDAENTWEQTFLNQKITLEEGAQDETERQNLSSAAATIQTDYQGDYMKIMQSPDYETPADRQKAIDELNSITTTRMKNLATIYGVELNWSPTDNPYTPPPSQEGVVSGNKDETINTWIQNNGVYTPDFNRWKGAFEQAAPGVLAMLSAEEIIDLFSRQYVNNNQYLV